MALLDTHTQISAIIGDFGSGLDHPECIAWGCDGYAYAGGEAGQIYRIDLARREFESLPKSTALSEVSVRMPSIVCTFVTATSSASSRMAQSARIATARAKCR